MKKDLVALLEKIDALKSEIESLRPLPPEREGRIFQKLRLDWNFHSNAIEGNSLTYGETNAFLMEGLTAKGKPLKDHLDLKGHNEAIDFLRHFIDKNEEITERDIRELHKMILVEPYKSKAITPGGQPSEKTIQIGQYKTQPNHVQTATGEMFYFASPEETPAKMHDLMEGYRANRGTMHPVELAALFHYDFVRIHPFDDGNGRMSRLLMNFILMQFGFPPVVIKASKDKKAEYFYALQLADKGGKEVFVEYIGEQLVHSMEVYLRGARGEDISEADDLDKEIELFRKSFGDDEIKERNTTDVLKRLFQTDIEKLYSALVAKCAKLNDLFLDNHHSVEPVRIAEWVENYYDTQEAGLYEHYNAGGFKLDFPIYESPIKISETWLIERIEQLVFSFNWLDFKKSQPSFDIKGDVWLYFERFSFIVKTKTFSIERLYHEGLNQKDVHSTCEAFIKETIEEIKQKTQPKNP